MQSEKVSNVDFIKAFRLHKISSVHLTNELKMSTFATTNVGLQDLEL